jgi:N2-acetyl-L-2,4-diaminobutanoate deacetylase
MTETKRAEQRPLVESPLESVRFTGLAPGPRLIVLGAVHGNEICGPAAIRRAIEECRTGDLLIRRGEVTFVPVANPKAYRQNTREGDRNLNRDLREKPVPLDHEDRLGNRLCGLLRQHDVLLDIHSFRGEGIPFVFFGPENNTGPLESFRRAEEEGAFARCLGTSVLIHGWLDVYARLIAARERLGLPRLPVTEGFGTTEYMRFAGGYGVTLECGAHEDPASAEIGYAAIRNALAHLGLVDAPLPERRLQTVIRIVDVIVCEADGDRIEGACRTGDALSAGQVIARRANGEAVTAPSASFLIFPNPNAKPGEGLCYFGVSSQRAFL